MRSDFIPSDVQDASERRRQPVAAFNAAPTTPSESFAAILMEPRDLAHQKTQLTGQVAAAPPGPPVSPFKGISAFTGAPAVIPSAVVPPVDALTTPSEVAAPAIEAAPAAAPAFAAAEPTPAEAAPAPSAPAAAPTAAPATAAPAAPAAPALATLTGRREPVPAFAAAKTDAAPAPAAPLETVQGNAAYGARGVTAEESLALANGDASSVPKGPSLFGDEGMTVADFFSIINPLQHLPLVGALYRDLTGDTIKPGGRVLGGMLFGGPMGMVGGAFNAAVENDIGTDTGGALLALVRGKPLGGTAAPAATLAAAPRPTPEATTAAAAAPDAADATQATAAAAATATAAKTAQAPTPAPLPVSAPRVMSPPRPITQPAPAEARILPSTPAAAPAVAAEAAAEPAKPAIPVSFAPAAAAAPATSAADAKPAGFAVSPAGKEFAVPARTNNVQPRQPIPTVRADLSRARELAPMAPLTARSEAPRPDRSVSPAQLLTPGLSQSDMNTGLPMSGASTRMPQVNSAPLGVPGLPPSALPDAMTKALDKYDALLKSRKGGVLNQQS